MLQAMKAGDVVEKEILRVVRGELDTAESRITGPLSDEEAERIIRKLIKSNEETFAHSSSEEQKQTLKREVQILTDLLPKLPTEDEIVALLAPVSDAIKAAGNDGQATGVAMKHLKSQNIAVDGKTTTLAVKRLRS
jgi:uncharacterized protein YqeY